MAIGLRGFWAGFTNCYATCFSTNLAESNFSSQAFQRNKHIQSVLTRDLFHFAASPILWPFPSNCEWNAGITHKCGKNSHCPPSACMAAVCMCAEPWCPCPDRCCAWPWEMAVRRSCWTAADSQAGKWPWSTGLRSRAQLPSTPHVWDHSMQGLPGHLHRPAEWRGGEKRNRNFSLESHHPKTERRSES